MMQGMAERLADKLSGCASEEEMQEIMKEHDQEVRRLETALSAEKYQQMESLKEKLRRRREERTATLLEKQKLEVNYRYQNWTITKIFLHFWLRL